MTPADREFLDRFEACTLADEEFKHVGHVRMAWLYLNSLPFEVALQEICDGIRRFGASRDALAMYHVTVTIAFAKIIAAKIRPGESFKEFVERNPELMSPRPLLLEYYSEDLLNSDQAQLHFVEPDRRQLPQ